jgi:predicted nucleic acid-binding protein
VYTIDASVWVNAFDQREPGHTISRQVLDQLAREETRILVPALVLAEVAGAISRTRQDPVQAQAFAEALGELPTVTVLPLDLPLARRALALAAQHGLRGADAVYAAVAVQTGSTLITLDQEHLARLGGIVPTRTPEAFLDDQAPPAAPPA